MKDLVKTTSELFKITKTQEEIENFLKLNNTNIQLVLQKLQDSKLTIGEKSKLENTLGLLKSLNLQIKKKKNISGAGLSASTPQASTSAASTTTSPAIFWETVSFYF